MALRIMRNDTQFRVEGQGLSLDWLADTRANRKATIVFLRLLTLDVQVFSYAALSIFLTRCFKAGVGSSRPNSRPTICLLESLSLKTS